MGTEGQPHGHPALGSHYLATASDVLRQQKKLAEQAMSQLPGEDLHWTPDPESNSVAIIVKHMAGNMRSRWRDFLTSDGEKPDRDRDAEFVDDIFSSDEVIRLWEEGWEVLFRTLAELGPEDLQRTVTIRGREHTVLEAIERQIAHYAQHVGQIVYLAKLRLGEGWQTVSIPRRRT